MNLKKRGLGRGLEALLVDVSAKEDRSALHHGDHLPPDAMNSAELPSASTIINKMTDPEAVALVLIETLQQENLNLLQEAVALRALVDEFEAMVRCL
jgi:ParB family chromosome partitioning protein